MKGLKMRRTASEIIHELELRVARLEGKNAGLIRPAKSAVDLVYDAYLYLSHEEYAYRAKFFVFHEVAVDPFKDDTYIEEYYEIEEMEGSDVVEIKSFIESFEKSLFLQIDRASQLLNHDERWNLPLYTYEDSKKDLKKSLNEMKEKGYSKRSYVDGENALGKIMDVFDGIEEISKNMLSLPQPFKKDWAIHRMYGLIISPKDLGGFNKPVSVAVDERVQGGGLASYELLPGGDVHKIRINTSNPQLAYKAIRHELIHAMQEEINLNKDISTGGLPVSKRNKRFLQHNKKEEARLKQIAKKKGIDPRNISIHALDDIEFYTRLMDEIEIYKLGGHGYDRDKIRDFIGRSVFFISLKTFQSNKYKKAVGLFIEAVQNS